MRSRSRRRRKNRRGLRGRNGRRLCCRIRRMLCGRSGRRLHGRIGYWLHGRSGRRLCDRSGFGLHRRSGSRRRRRSRGRMCGPERMRTRDRSGQLCRRNRLGRRLGRGRGVVRCGGDGHGLCCGRRGCSRLRGGLGPRRNRRRRCGARLRAGFRLRRVLGFRLGLRRRFRYGFLHGVEGLGGDGERGSHLLGRAGIARGQSLGGGIGLRQSRQGSFERHRRFLNAPSALQCSSLSRIGRLERSQRDALRRGHHGLVSRRGGVCRLRSGRAVRGLAGCGMGTRRGAIVRCRAGRSHGAGRHCRRPRRSERSGRRERRRSPGCRGRLRHSGHRLRFRHRGPHGRRMRRGPHGRRGRGGRFGRRGRGEAVRSLGCGRAVGSRGLRAVLLLLFLVFLLSHVPCLVGRARSSVRGCQTRMRWCSVVLLARNSSVLVDARWFSVLVISVLSSH